MSRASRGHSAGTASRVESLAGVRVRRHDARYHGWIGLHCQKRGQGQGAEGPAGTHLGT